MRAALYDQREAETRVAQTNAALSQADEKIDAVVTETHKDRSQIPMEGTVRMKGHVEVTAPPSDLSSIDGNEESEERNCHTPNSLSSEENEVFSFVLVCQKKFSQNKTETFFSLKTLPN